MNSKLGLLLLASLIIAQAAYAGGKEGGGGDKCQDRIEAIRNDISDWIDAGGADALELPSGMSLDTYKLKMQLEIALTRANSQHSIVCKDNPKEVVVGHSEKICESAYPNRPRITCYRKGFMSLSDDNQYFMVHHEFAVLAGFEDQVGERSDYPLSDQITGYLQEETVKKLAVKPAGSSSTLTVASVTSASGSEVLKNFFNEVYYYPAYESPNEPTGVIDAANGFHFVDLATDSNPGEEPSKNPGLVYFKISVPEKVKFTQPVAIAAYVTENIASGGAATPVFVPIASVNQTMCGSNGDAICFNQIFAGGQAGNYSYAARFPMGGEITVGINAQSICRSMETIAGPAAAPNFCASLNNPTEPGGMTGDVPMTVKFAIFNQSDLNDAYLNNPSALPVAQAGPVSATLSFVRLSADPTAPKQAALCNLSAPWVVNPKDGGLEIDSSLFGVAGDPTGTGLGAVIAVANLGTTVNDQVSNYTTGNSVPMGYFVPKGRFDFGQFQSSTPTQTYAYRVGFLVRDYAGYVFDDGSGGNDGPCTFAHQYITSSISGILKSHH